MERLGRRRRRRRPVAVCLRLAVLAGPGNGDACARVVCPFRWKWSEAGGVCGELQVRKTASRTRGDEVFSEVREHAGLPEELELHCLRHTYITPGRVGYPERFVQE
ncbi:hypothetical protein ACQ86F_32120 [Streptomyces venezuelae ATCC 10712]